MWDTTGQERFRATIRPYYKGVSGALVTFNTAQEKTFDNLTWWLQELKDHCDPDVIFILVAHKIDMKRDCTVGAETARDFADRNGMGYVETSLEDIADFEAAFSAAVRKIHRIRMKQSSSSDVTCIKCLRNARKVSSDEEDDEEISDGSIGDEPKETSSFYV